MGKCTQYDLLRTLYSHFMQWYSHVLRNFHNWWIHPIIIFLQWFLRCSLHVTLSSMVSCCTEIAHTTQNRLFEYRSHSPIEKILQIQQLFIPFFMASFVSSFLHDVSSLCKKGFFFIILTRCPYFNVAV